MGLRIRTTKCKWDLTSESYEGGDDLRDESATTILLRLTKHVVEFEYWMNFVPNYIWEGGRVYPLFQRKGPNGSL